MFLSKTTSTLVLLGVCALPADARADDLEDDQVAAAVERELLYDRAVPSNRIDLSCADGVLTLEGSVSNVLARERAVRIAETVKGVRSVVDLVEVRPLATRLDADVRDDVTQALLQDPAADSYEVSVSVADGYVTLAGTVDSWRERRLAETVAKGVRGVVGVRNDITYERDAERSDHEIRADVEAALQWSVLVDGGLITVEVQDGEVRLSGIVGSAAERRVARSSAWTTGVTAVDDSRLQVARWARDPDLRQAKYVQRPAAEIQQAVEAALRRDPRVFSFDVDASVTGGLVALRGVVDNLEAKRAAEMDARNTVGVSRVLNYIKVRPEGEIEDGAVAQSIRDAFFRSPDVERFELSVVVREGVAYLGGTVDSHYERMRAEDLASRVAGVVEVKNHVQVGELAAYTYDRWVDPWWTPSYRYRVVPYRSARTDEDIAESIEDELFWSPFVDSADVTVEVEGGVATLTGTVASHMEKGAARDNAYEGGATDVRDRLQVSLSEL